MPVVLTDYTNKVWAIEQPDDGLLHAGYTGQPGPRVTDLLDFATSRSEQFAKFVEKKRQEERGDATKRKRKLFTASGGTELPESGRTGGPGSK